MQTACRCYKRTTQLRNVVYSGIQHAAEDRKLPSRNSTSAITYISRKERQNTSTWHSDNHLVFSVLNGRLVTQFNKLPQSSVSRRISIKRQILQVTLISSQACLLVPFCFLITIYINGNNTDVSSDILVKLTTLKSVLLFSEKFLFSQTSVTVRRYSIQ
jgi:hypothetical protein